MSVVTVYTRAQSGIDAPGVAVEVHLAGGLPGLSIVGLVETAVRESRERVRAALTQSGFEVPQRKIVVNLAPADLPKSGGRYDLAIALGILAVSTQVEAERLRGFEFFGELAFTGGLREVRALLPGVLGALRASRRCLIPVAAAEQVAPAADERVLIAAHLVDVVRYLNGEQKLKSMSHVESIDEADASEDISDIRGQAQARRALQIAAAGGHNLLMVGPPGAGKTMLARRMPGLLPALDRPRLIENMVLQSVARAPRPVRCSRPPFRAPHHTASAAALVGGGNPPVPGEISLAHNGVLFLDELPEFSRPVLEALREPMETGQVRIARARHSVVFPARFQLVAAMNPCPCGYAGDVEVACRCSPDQVRAYQGRISGPLLDRIDLGVFLHRETILLDAAAPVVNDSSAKLRGTVERALSRQRQRARCPNAGLSGDRLRLHCWPEPSGRRLLERAAERFKLSRRGCDSVLRVARTIADLAEEDPPVERHVAEALQLRVQLSPGSKADM